MHTLVHTHTPFVRVAGEHQIRELQRLIDETFQQFALDDSEDDDFGDCDTSLGGGVDSTHSFVQPGLSSLSIGNLRDDISGSSDVIAPLTSSSSFALGCGTGLTGSASLAGATGLTAPSSRPSRHSFA